MKPHNYQNWITFLLDQVILPPVALLQTTGDTCNMELCRWQYDRWQKSPNSPEWIRSSTLTLSMSNAGSFCLMQWRNYQYLKDSHRDGQDNVDWGLEPSVTRYFTINANHTTDLGTFVQKKCHAFILNTLSQEVIERPFVYHNSKFFSVWRSFWPHFKLKS